MKKLAVLLLTMVVGLTAAAAQDTSTGASGKEKQKTTEAGAFRWHGIIQRHNQEKSTLDVERKGTVRVVVYNDATKWTNHGATADPKDFTDGADVIVHGNLDKDGRVVATRIDLRRR